MRRERNETFAKLLYSWIQSNHPDQVIVPNGTIQEMGVAYRVAKWLGTPVTTYEFGEQRKRIWIAQNREVMRQETDDLWAVRKDALATDGDLEKVRSMFSARQKADLWGNFSRRWQGSDRVGQEKIREALLRDRKSVV